MITAVPFRHIIGVEGRLGKGVDGLHGCSTIGVGSCGWSRMMSELEGATISFVLMCSILMVGARVGLSNVNLNCRGTDPPPQPGSDHPS